LTYRIREVDGEDEDVADILREMHEACFGDSAPQINPDRGYWWLAYGHNELGGFCGLTPTYPDPLMGYLKRVGVLRGHRGHGLQRRFVRVREAKARRLGFHSIVTDTTDNPPSANNLIECGYRIFMPDEPWGFPQTIYWRKPL
jgi:GNAT superfamily N-acetyltransferase